MTKVSPPQPGVTIVLASVVIGIFLWGLFLMLGSDVQNWLLAFLRSHTSIPNWLLLELCILGATVGLYNLVKLWLEERALFEFYCEDIVDGIHWKWIDGPHQNNTRSLVPHCIHDQSPLEIINDTPPSALCPTCKKSVDLAMELDFLKRRVKIEIERRWKNGSWKTAKRRISKKNEEVGLRSR